MRPTVTTPTSPKPTPPRRRRYVRPNRGGGVGGQNLVQESGRGAPRVGDRLGSRDGDHHTEQGNHGWGDSEHVSPRCDDAAHPPPAGKVQSETDRHEGEAGGLAEYGSNIGVGGCQQGE